MKQEQRRRERSFEVSLAVLCDLAAIESVPLSCQCEPTCANARCPGQCFEKKASVENRKVGPCFDTLMFKGFSGVLKNNLNRCRYGGKDWDGEERRAIDEV